MQVPKRIIAFFISLSIVGIAIAFILNADCVDEKWNQIMVESEIIRLEAQVSALEDQNRTLVEIAKELESELNEHKHDDPPSALPPE